MPILTHQAQPTKKEHDSVIAKGRAGIIAKIEKVLWPIDDGIDRMSVGVVNRAIAEVKAVIGDFLGSVFPGKSRQSPPAKKPSLYPSHT